MANQVRLTLLQPEGATSDVDWTGKLTQALSRLPTVKEKIVKIVQVKLFILRAHGSGARSAKPYIHMSSFWMQFQRNAAWGEPFGKVGYPLKPFAGALSIYSSDVDSLKELVSTTLKENANENSPPVWLVGYDEVKMSKAPKDPSKPLAKFMGLIARNPSLTTPQFHSQWSGPHAALFISKPLPQEHVVFYSQFHCSPEWTEDFAKLGLNTAVYEGVVEIWCETIEDIESIFTSKEHMEEIMPDEAILVHLEESGIMTGVDVVETNKYM